MTGDGGMVITMIRDHRSVFTLFAISLFGLGAVRAQSPTPTPAPEVKLGDYKVTAAFEAGYRWRSVTGNMNKYGSDLNYGRGFRSFDSNLLLEAPDGRGKFFDSLLVSTSGWGSDPSGATRVNMEKTGAYRFDGSVRRVHYFNNLFNFVNPINLPDSEHAQNIRHTFGDADLTIYPESERFRLKLGMSFNNAKGTGYSTERFFSDEFVVNSQAKGSSLDLRAGAEGKLFGFDWGILGGMRDFNDRPSFFLPGPSQGNTTTNQSRLDTLYKRSPLDGTVYYGIFNLHRTFRQKLDVTARAIYSSSSSVSATEMSMTGRDNTNPVGIIVTSNVITAYASAKRPQTRADIGFTYRASDKFRISNTFSFDQFAVNGAENFSERWTKASGATQLSITQSAAYRVEAYRRLMNMVEGDYQFNGRVSMHIGYRFTRRRVRQEGYDFNILSGTGVPVAVTNPLFLCDPSGTTRNPHRICEGEENSTNAFIAGMKIKPVKNWTIFWDLERGQADNVFTRLENYHYTNFRFRNRLSFDKVSINLSALSKDDENPSDPQAGIIVPANVSYITNIKNRFYTGSVDWEARPEFWISSGYTYRHLTSYTPIVIPISGAPGTYVYGYSQFFIRDHYFFFDVTAKPVKRLSIYGSYRIDRDKGQGTRVSAPVASIANPNIVGSYPMRFATPEFRAAVQLTKNIDWNFGAQFYNYRDAQTPFQNYRAVLPYTALRIYFGQRAGDR